MNSVRAFHASTVAADELRSITADYVALEDLRTIRRLLMARCGFLAGTIAAVGLGFGWLSRMASWCGVAVFLALPAVTWLIERSRVRRLARRLDTIPPASPHTSESPSA